MTEPETVEQITVPLSARVSRELVWLHSQTGLSKTDLVNRAISLYVLIEKGRQQGQQLAFYDLATHEVQVVHLT